MKSNIVLLSFIVTPNITLGCLPINKLKKGQNFSCECKGIGGNPPAKVTWYENNTKIDGGTEKANLVLTDVDEDDNGTYICVAKSYENAVDKKVTNITVG